MTREPHANPSVRLPGAASIGRSLDIYYRDRARTLRMDRLNAAFAGPGALVFDIGAHVGDRTASFHRLGARVVALEPQPRVFRALRLIHGRKGGITLSRQAAGRAAGEIAMHVNSRNPTVSTVEREFVEAAADAPGWQGQQWDGTVIVPVTTLDALIATHGLPDFVKIDVEGHELSVLRGVSVALPALSFEFTTIQRGAVHDCIGRLSELGRYAFNYTIGESHALVGADWLDADDLRRAIDALPDAANSGDVYARRA